MRKKWIKFLDHLIEYSLYIMIIQIPISKAGIEIFACLAIFAFCVKKILNTDFKLFLKPIDLNFACFFGRQVITKISNVKFGINFFLFCFIVFNTLSLLNSGPYFKKSLIALLFKWGEYFLIFFAIEDTFYNHKRIRNAVFIFLSISILLSIDGLSQYFFGLEFLRHRNLGITFQGVYAMTAAFNHYNDFGAYITVIFLMMLSLFISNKKWPYRLAYVPALVLIETCLLLTFSRGSWIGSILGLFLMLFVSRKYKEFIFICGILIFTLIALPGTKTMIARLNFILQAGGDTDRLIVWKIALNMIKENPFLGKGLGTFMDYFSKRSSLTPQYAHNCFLQIWAETGIFSLLSFISFIMALLLRGIAVFKKTNDYILLGILCGLLAFLVHSFFDTDLYSLQLAVLFWTVAGILAAAINIAPLRKKNIN
ncbi:MAG: O-antigen ligase family protein [Candidatus Omnitrophota bacterium]